MSFNTASFFGRHAVIEKDWSFCYNLGDMAQEAMKKRR